MRSPRTGLLCRFGLIAALVGIAAADVRAQGNAQSTRPSDGNVHSGARPSDRPLTADEMRAVKPMPLPSVDGPGIAPPVNPEPSRRLGTPGNTPGSQGSSTK